MKNAYCVLLMFLLFVYGLNGQDFERYKLRGDTSIESEILNYEKPLRVIVPFDFQVGIKGQSYPLIVIFDMQNSRSFDYTLRTIDYLTANEQMPAAVIIGVESDQMNRYAETQWPVSDPTGKAHLMTEFLFKELIPFARNHFHASMYTMLIGHSRYGYFTTYQRFTRGDDLHAVISNSPFFAQNNVSLTDSLPEVFESMRPEHQLYYRFCIGNDYPDEYDRMITRLNEAHKSNASLNFKGILMSQADHNVTPGLHTGTALFEIFEFWSACQNAYSRDMTMGVEELEGLKQKIVSHYGVDLPFSLGVLNGKGWAFFNEKKYLEAIGAWNVMLSAYPNFAEGYLFQAYAKQELKLDFTAELSEFFQAMEVTTVYSDEEREELLEEARGLKK
jgi:predicted alpha/beta superfamily hydrolase